MRNLYTALFIILACANISHGRETEKKDKFDIPYELLTFSRREEFREVVAKHTIARTLRDIEFEIDEYALIFMMDHPFFLSATLRAMRIKDYLIKPGKDGMYLFDDRKGLSGKFEVVYSRSGQRYYYGYGGYHGLILKLQGRGALLLEYRMGQGTPPIVYINANFYTKIENIILRVLVKIMKPIIIPLVDKKLYEFIESAQKLAIEITEHPEKVYQAVKESGYADLKELEEFRKLTFPVAGGN
ncbi:MAG: hypothetical protein ACE5GV_01975 [Candidatus Scalindua sp.]